MGENISRLQSRRGRKVHSAFHAEHLGFRDMNLMVIDPIQDLLKVSASVRNVEVRKRIFDSLHPVVSEHRHVATTHDVLPEHFDAMV